MNSDSSRPDGLGLGLSIVKRTAELLGCSVNVESSPGKGSSFFVDVPAGTTSGVEAMAIERPQVLAATGGRILVVDDEPAIVDATTMVLEMEGFDVLSAASVDEVKMCMRDMTNPPDILITDFHLRNGETGLVVISAVRERFESNIPAVVLSGDTSNRIVLAELEETTFLTKPVDVDALLTKVHQLIDDR